MCIISIPGMYAHLFNSHQNTQPDTPTQCLGMKLRKDGLEYQDFVVFVVSPQILQIEPPDWFKEAIFAKSLANI